MEPVGDIARGAARARNTMDIYAFHPDLSAEFRFAFLGCRAPESRVANALYPRAWDSLDTLRTALLRHLSGGGDLERGEVETASREVNASMTWAYGEARWWSLPTRSREPWRHPLGLDVLAWWGAAVAAAHFDRVQCTQRGERHRRSLAAARAADHLGSVLEDWCGFWRPGLLREWSTREKYRAAWKRYLKAEAAAGGLSLLVTQRQAVVVPPAPPPRVPFRPRLVHSA